jgi:hypothetical protein
MIRQMIAALLVLAPLYTLASESETMHFRVFLDDREIGYHRFILTPGDGGSHRVISEASYKVSFLFFTAYRYQHRSEERWQGGCLVGIDARTDDDGDIYRVTGSSTGDGLRLIVNDRSRVIERDCVRSFAYWRPRLLDTDALLNAQTGELQPVDYRQRGPDSLPWRETPARAVRLLLPDSHIDLWYGGNDDWLGLRSPVAGDRLLVYRRDDNAANPEEGQ